MKTQIQSNVQTKLMTIAMVLLAIEQCKANNSPYCIIDMQALEAPALNKSFNTIPAPQFLIPQSSSSLPCMHIDIAQALQQVHKELEERGLAIKVLYSAQESVSMLTQSHGSHCTHNSVDVTLVTQEGYEVLMPSEYGTQQKITQSTNALAAQKNSEMLKTVMMRHGFEPGNQWWEYNLKAA